MNKTLTDKQLAEIRERDATWNPREIGVSRDDRRALLKHIDAEREQHAAEVARLERLRYNATCECGNVLPVISRGEQDSGVESHYLQSCCDECLSDELEVYLGSEHHD